MNINDLINKDEIKKEHEKAKAGGGEMGDSRFWRIPDLKSTVRLLPRLESQVPWKTVYSHRFSGSGERIFGTCLKTFGKKDCPICKQAWAFHEREDKESQDIGYECRPTPRYMFNCYIVNDPVKPENNGTVKIISVGKKLFDLILESYNSEDLGKVIFDAVNGMDFEINRKQSGDNPKFPDYSSSRFVFKKYGVVKDWKELQDKLINIDELIKEETAEELKKKFKFMGFETSASTPKTQAKAKVKEESKEDEDFDELVDNEEPAVEGSEVSDEIDIDEELDGLGDLED